jgi:hypothetical protein
VSGVLCGSPLRRCDCSLARSGSFLAGLIWHFNIKHDFHFLNKANKASLGPRGPFKLVIPGFSSHLCNFSFNDTRLVFPTFAVALASRTFQATSKLRLTCDPGPTLNSDYHQDRFDNQAVIPQPAIQTIRILFHSFSSYGLFLRSPLWSRPLSSITAPPAPLRQHLPRQHTLRFPERTLQDLAAGRSHTGRCFSVGYTSPSLVHSPPRPSSRHTFHLCGRPSPPPPGQDSLRAEFRLLVQL